MTIAHIPGSLSPAATGPPAAGATAPVGAVSRDRRLQASQKADAPEPAPGRSELEEVRTLASQSGLELRLQTLPEDHSVILMRIVRPETGEVIREFPPPELAKVLSALRSGAGLHVDHRA